MLLPHRLIHILSQRTRTCTKATVSATSLNSQCVQNSRAHPNITIIVIDTNNQNDLRRVLLVKTETTDSRRQLQTISHHRNRDPRQSGVAENYIKEGGKKNPQRKSPYNLKAGTSSSSSSSSCKLRRSTDKTLLCTVSCHKQKLSSR